MTAPDKSPIDAAVDEAYETWLTSNAADGESDVRNAMRLAIGAYRVKARDCSPAMELWTIAARAEHWISTIPGGEVMCKAIQEVLTKTVLIRLTHTGARW